MEIIAKQEYTDKYVSLYEGEIRNIPDPIALKLIELNIVAEHSDSEGGEDTGSSPRLRNVTLNFDTLKLNETYSTINNWFTNNGDFVVLKLNGDTVGFFTGIGYSSREGKYWVRALAGVGAGDLSNHLFYCLTENDYPEYPDPESESGESSGS